MFKYIATLSILAMTLLFSVNCSVTESTNIKTSGIWTHFVIENNQGVIRAYAVLRVGGATGTIVDLSGGEFIEVNGARLNEWVEPVTGYHWSSGLITESVNFEYLFNFVRTDEEIGTILHLPEVPVISEPVPDQMECFDLPIAIAWNADAPGDSVTVTISGECIDTFSQTLPSDTGSYEVDGIPPIDGFVDGCPLTITITRWYEGSPNPAFQGGRIEQKAIDSIPVDITYCDAR
ncbi:hypothetical protein KJ975_03570 [Myxococcota bacterium]|nr:hypothetical protein [Myxococcota bacterium]